MTEELKAKRTVVRRKLTTVLKKLEALQNREDHESQDTGARGDAVGGQARALFSEMEKLLDQLEFLNDNIAEDQEEEEALQDYEAFLNLKVRQSTLKEQLITTNRRDDQPREANTSSDLNGNASVASGPSQAQVDVPLKRLQDIDVYYGDPLKWQSFWDSFYHSVDKFDQVSKCQKMTYLRKFLSGEAARAIEGWSTTDANYDSAIAHLKKRFGDAEDRKQALWAQLISLEKVKSENTPAMRRLLDTARSTVRSLEALGIPMESFSSMLKVLIRQKIPSSMDTQWLLSRPEVDEASADEMLTYLERKVRAREQADLLSRVEADPSQSVKRHPSRSTSSRYASGPDRMTVVAVSERKCFFCEDTSHTLWNCAQSYEERKAVVKRKAACFNCFRTDHPVYRCPSNSRCKQCGRKHHTSIHPRNETEGRSETKPLEANEATVTKASVGHHTSITDVVLPVVSIPVYGKTTSTARCLLDTGSTATFISESLADMIKAPFVRSINLELSTFAASGQQSVSARVVRCKLKSTDDRLLSFEPIVLKDLGIKQVAPSPLLPCVRELRQQHGVELSDMGGTLSPGINMLIGSDMYAKITTGRRIVLNGGAVALETCFGWSLQGPVQPGHRSSTAVVSYLKAANLTLEEKVSAFWNIEEMAHTERETDIDPFKKSIQFNGDRYEVPLLWKGTERPTANKSSAARLYTVQRGRAARNNRWDQYQQVMEEYKEFGATEDDPLGDSDEGYFLPHHAVINPSSDTHPMRIVFNASAKQGGDGLSLNDCLDTGPNLLPHVSSLLLKFRSGVHPITGDLKKAFFTVSVAPSDRRYLRLMWDPPQRMSRVPFGVNCSPYLLQVTILHHLQVCVERGDLSVEMFLTISGALYMDDLIASFCTAQDKEKFIEHATHTFSTAGMTVHKWRGLIDNPNEESRTSNVLGVKWDRYEDELKIVPPDEAEGSVQTKRQFLSLLASVFDPLGLLSPLTLMGKIILQKLWREENLTWDADMSPSLQEEVDQWTEGLRSVSSVSFPRGVALSPAVVIHVFVDASEAGMGAVAYAVSQNPYLLCSKTKVAPIKNVSLPRLELQAAVLGVRLLDIILPNLPITPARIQFWSDSEIALAWIKSNSTRQWNTFVANRVAEVQRCTSADQWSHVPGKENPADLASRGTVITKLLSSDSFWQSGPTWLANEENWPVGKSSFQTNQEKKSATVATVVDKSQVENEVDLFPHISDWRTLTRVTAWILRWKSCKSMGAKGELKAEEVEEGEKSLVRYIQRQSFSTDISQLKRGLLSNSSKLWRLDPFMDEEGILRVGGRLHQAPLPWSAKHPIVLPYKHRQSEVLVQSTHLNLLHSGVDVMTNHLRRRFWIMKVRRLCRDVRTKCLVCKRMEAPMPAVNPKFAPLPQDRVNLSTPFQACGIDYAGPLKVKENNSVTSAYVLLFVCATTRAVHAEVTDTLTTAEFILAFRKFAARFEVPKLIRSDNAKTFRKAATILKVDWRFLPPRAPWWGGFYERFCQLIKRPLRKVINGALVTKKELECLIAEIQKVVNLRPLTTPSDDPKDPNPITPAGLLGQSYSPEDPSVELDQRQLTNRQRYQQRISDLLKRRWKLEYLSSLNILAKRTSFSGLIKSGDIVLLDNEKPRSTWPLARILEAIPGADGIVRVVKLRCRGTDLFRPVQKLLPLEIAVSSPQPALGSDDQANPLKENSQVVPPPPSTFDQSKMQTKAPTSPCVKRSQTRSGRLVKTRQLLNL